MARAQALIRTASYVVGGGIALLFAAFDAGWPQVPCALVGALAGYLLAQVIHDEGSTGMS